MSDNQFVIIFYNGAHQHDGPGPNDYIIHEHDGPPDHNHVLHTVTYPFDEDAHADNGDIKYDPAIYPDESEATNHDGPVAALGIGGDDG